MTQSADEFATFADRVAAATNSHDIEAVVACFADDYLNEAPVHPARSFRGRDQVRRNWTQIFASVPDIEVTVLRADQVDDQVWSEWEMRGTRVDGVPHLMRGVMRFTVEGEEATAVRFYLEPVDVQDVDTDESVRQLLTSPRP
jgi:ketosteroid isomerase-like protein